MAKSVGRRGLTQFGNGLLRAWRAIVVDSKNRS